LKKCRNTEEVEMAKNAPSNNGKKFQFQMGWGGMAAIFFSTICVLLWVFVLGFWAGQRVTEKKYAQGAFFQQAQPLTSETTPQPPAPQAPPEPKPVEEARTVPPISAVPLEQVSPPVDQLAQEQPIKPEVAEPKPIKPETKPEIKSIAKPVVEEKHEKIAQKPGAERPKTPAVAPVAAPAVKENRPVPGQETAKKDDMALVEAKIKKIEEKKTGAIHSELAKPAAGASAKPDAKVDTKTAASSGYYVLQVAAFKDRAQAEIELKKYESKGFKGKLRTVDLGPEKGTWTRVYIGHYETIEKAKAAQNELASKGQSKPSYVVMLQD